MKKEGNRVSHDWLAINHGLQTEESLRRWTSLGLGLLGFSFFGFPGDRFCGDSTGRHSVFDQGIEAVAYLG